MALATTILGRTKFGNKDVVFGKGVISGDVATGDVLTGLNRIEYFHLTVQGATQKGCSIDETLPLAGSGDVTVVTETNNQTFYWMAVGL